MINQFNESDQTDNFINIDEIDQAVNFDVNSDVNFNINFDVNFNVNSDVNFDQTDKINKIDEFQSKTFLSSFSLENAYEADYQMQSFADRIDKFLFSE